MPVTLNLKVLGKQTHIFQIVVLETDSVSQFKEDIFDATGIKKAYQRLVHNKHIMEDMYDLRKYRVKDGDVVMVYRSTHNI